MMTIFAGLAHSRQSNFDDLFHKLSVHTRVARWYIHFQTNWVNFGGSCKDVGIFYDTIILPSFGVLHAHLVYFEVIWYISPRFGTLFRGKSGNLGSHWFTRAKVSRGFAVNAVVVGVALFRIRK
jgi:hypothetical protein